MRIGKVIGNVTLNRCLDSFVGGSYRVTVPLSIADLKGEGKEAAEPIVVFDTLGAGEGSLIAISEGGEASQPFKPAVKPVDAYNAAILDRIDL